MADITAGLPTLGPQEVQAQQDRARLAALRPDVAAVRSGAVPSFTFRIPDDVSAAVAAGLQALRGPAPVGGPGPSLADTLAARAQDLTPAPASPALAGPPLPAMTAPAPGAAPAAPVVSNAVPASPQITPSNDTGAAPASAAAPVAARAPRAAGAGMPAAAPAPLVPGETGFYLGSQLVPYGTSMNFSGGALTGFSTPGGGGGGGASMDNLPGGGKIVGGRFADPRDALEYGFRLQSQYRDDSIRAILASAGNGSELGYRARVAALASAFGSNNFGADSVGGANSLNQAIAHITGAEVGAGATIGAAQIGAGAQLAHIGESGREFDATPRPIGQTAFTDPATGLTTQATHYGMPASAVPLVPIDAAIPKAKPVEGSTGTLKDGRRFVIKNGQPVVTK